MANDLRVVKTTNIIQWQSDQNSWQREKKRIEDYGKLWKKAVAQCSKEQNAYLQATQKVQIVQTRTTERRQKAESSVTNELRNQKREQAALLRQQQRLATIKARNERDYRSLSQRFDKWGTFDKYKGQLGELQAKRSSMTAGEYTARAGMLTMDMKAHQDKWNKLDSVINKTSTSLKSFNSRLNSFLLKAGFAVGGISALMAKAFTANASNNQSYFGLLAQNKDDKAKTNDQMKWIGDMAEKYGMDLLETQKDYMKFHGATQSSMDENTRRGLFESLAIKATASGVDPEAQSRALKALEQSSSKGKVAMEELRSQLGDALPGAVNDFFEAWKKTTGKSSASFKDFEKAVSDGNVQLEKLAPALTTIWGAAAETEAFANALQQPEKALQRLKSTMDKCMISFMGTVDSGDGVTSVAEAISYAFSDLRNAMGEVDWKSFGEDVGEFLYDLQYKFWTLWYSTLKPLGEKLMEFCKWIGNTFNIDLASAVMWVLEFKAVMTALSIVGGVAKSGWEFYRMAKAFIGLMNTSGGAVAGVLGKLGAVAAAVVGGGLAADWTWDNIIMPANDAMYGDETTAGGNLKKDSPLGKAYDAIVGWWQHGKESGKFPDWYPGVNNAPIVPPAVAMPTPTINTSQAMPVPQMSPAFMQQAGVNPSLNIRTEGELQGEINVKVDMVNQDTYVDQRIDAKIHDYDTQILNMIGVGSY